MTELDREGRSGLHYAALEGRTAEVRQAIESGEDVGVADKGGFTPLHFAAQQGHIVVAQMLVDAGAPIEARNRFGNTPLWVALMNRGLAEGEAVVSLLLACGASIDTENDSGISVRQMAERMGYALPSA